MQLRKTQTKINNQQQHNQAATEVTLLGVLLDIKLFFELHVKNIAKKAYWKYTTIRKLQKCLPKNIAIKIVKTFIHPHFNYCSVLLTASPVQTRNMVDSIFYRSCQNTLNDHVSTREVLIDQLQLQP